ncbi:MAG TPA: putative lipid II flippase FtsW [Solirubrobacteraceae bacterium]|nr:putative lipid II flippase FtsW [Solirubrobacteraceae bacterium]
MSRRRSPPRRAAEQTLEHRILLTATLCLLAGGAVMVYSASSARTLLAGQGDGTAYLVKYLAFGAVGLVALHVVMRLPLDLVRRFTPALLGVAFFLCLLVRVPGVGIEVGGATRWIGAGPIQFQPSELMKLALVLYAVHLLALRPQIVQTVRDVASPLLLVAGGAAVLVATQPDLGTALVICFAMAALLVAAGMPVRVLATIGGAGAGAVLLFALAAPYRRERLTSFLDPWAEAGGDGFQAVQGQIAVGSGGLFGRGLGESVQKINYLPEAHTDFILAVIGEELGVAGVLGLLFLYGLIAYAGLRVAKTARGPYAQLLATGVTSLILCQALLNVFTVLGLAPLTGVPLPFISSGSSSLLVLLTAMGLLLNVASGGRSDLKAVRAPDRARSGHGTQRGDRGGRDGGARRAGARGGRRAAG